MRTTIKIIIVVLLVILAYFIAKLLRAGNQEYTTSETIIFQGPAQNMEQPVNTSTVPKYQQKNAKTSLTKEDANNQINNQTKSKPTMQDQTELAALVPNQNQQEEVLIDGQGQAGSNYVEVTTTPSTTSKNTNNKTSKQAPVQNTTAGQTSNDGGAYAEASVIIGGDNQPQSVYGNSTTQQPQSVYDNTPNYPSGPPAFEVIEGD